MPGDRRPKLGSDTGWRPAFRGGHRPVLYLVAFFAVWVLFTNLLHRALFPADSVTLQVRLLGIVSSAVQIGVVVWILRREAVTIGDLGATRRHLSSAVVAALGVVVAFNVAGAGLLAFRGHDVALSVYPRYRSEGLSLDTIGLSAGYFYLFVGPAEELAFRGYLQNKLVGLPDGLGDYERIAVGIVGAAFVFALLHLPLLLAVGGAGPGAALGVVLRNLISGVLLGILYEATRNLCFAALVHGFGDFLPVFVDAGGAAWPARTYMILLLVPTVLAYRRWATGASMPNFRSTA